MSRILNIHNLLMHSRAAGPGVRAAIWFQGCSRGCAGCFNPRTHSHEPCRLVPVEALVHALQGRAGEIEGITVSGGEPLEQAEGLLDLITGVRGRTDLSVILFTGSTEAEIAEHPLGAALLENTDVLIAGPFRRDLVVSRGLLGSANQTIRLLSPRYSRQEIEATPETEVIIDRYGQMFISGIGPPRLVDSLETTLWETVD